MNYFIKEEKKVEYLELIYDLIFVYMIGRENSLLESIQNGFTSPDAFMVYVFCTLSIIQIWNFTTFYINMFGRNGVRDHIFLLLNMYLLYFLGQGVRINATDYTMQYHIAWGLILVNIGLQYLIELRNHRADVWNRDIIRRMAITLFAEAVLVFVAAGLKPMPSGILSYAAIAAGIILTMLGKKFSIGGQVDFMHLTERAMLFVVFTFGEMVIAVAVYFEGNEGLDPGRIYYSLMAFLIAVGLFLSYEVVYDHLLDRGGDYNGLVYMLLHIFIIFAISNATVALIFMHEETVHLMPKLLMLTGSLVGYFLFLFLLKGHFRLRCRLKPGFIAKMVLLSAAFVILMIIFRERTAVNILLSVIYVYLVVLALYRMKEVQDEIRRDKAQR